MKKETPGLKMILAGLATLALLILMILKGFEMVPVFQSVAAEIAVLCILFAGSALFIIGGLKEVLDEFFETSNKPQKF